MVVLKRLSGDPGGSDIIMVRARQRSKVCRVESAHLPWDAVFDVIKRVFGEWARCPWAVASEL